MSFFAVLRSYSVACLILSVMGVVMGGPAHAQQASPASAVVLTYYQALEQTMKNGPSLGFDGRVAKLDPVVRKAFDLPFMARYAVGPAWREANKGQQDRLSEAFARFSVATYAGRFSKYDGEVFEVLGEKPMGDTVLVETRLMPKGEAPVKLNYRLRKSADGQMKIVDVYLDAAISELATRRADFSAVVKREGFEALISHLESKAQAMKSGGAK